MSNAKIGLLGGGAFALALVAGAGGFKAGQFYEKVTYLEGRVASFEQAGVQLGSSPALQSTTQNYYPDAPSIDFGTAAAPPVAAPLPAQSSLNADGVPVQLAPVLADAETASGLLSALSKATAFAADGEVSHEQPIYAFFDPRCPYCKQAMSELNGRAKVNWIPVSLLGDLDTGSSMIEAMRSLEVQAAVQAAADGALPDATGTAETQEQLQENASILLALYEGATDVVAVPSFLVPRADGTATFYRGFDRGDGAILTEAYGS